MPTARFLLGEVQTATNRTPRQINRSLIFNQIRTMQPISRAELARASGLQRSTVSLIVEELLAERWIVEGWIGESPRGRKPTVLVLNQRRCVLALDVHPTQTSLAVTDLSGEILEETRLVLPEDPQKVIDAILAEIRRTIGAHEDRSFEGIGITFPGRFSNRLNRTVFAPNVKWPIAEIKSRTEDATGLSVMIENVANACALYEVWFGHSDVSQDLVVVNVSEGIGTGIFANGRLLRGQHDVAGEFGHVQLEPDGPPCGCGGVGCWETLASNRAALRHYNQLSSVPASSFEDIIQMAESGERFAVEAITAMSDALGRGLRMVISALAPSEIVVVGEITRLWSMVLPVLDEQLRRFPLISIPKIRVTDDPEKARLRSAVALVMNGKALWSTKGLKDHRAVPAGD